MQSKRLTGVFAFISSALLAAAEQPDADVNVALAKWGATATASSIYGPGYEADRAIDGKVGKEHDKWNSAANATPHWLLVDLGRMQTIHRVVIRHEGVRGQGAVYNTSAFQVQRGESAAGPWTDLVPPVTGNKENESDLSFAPTPVRWLRLLVTTGEQGGRNEYARIFEVEAYAARSSLDVLLAGFSWASPPKYRKAAGGIEQLAVLEMVSGPAAASAPMRLEVVGAPPVELPPAARSGRQEFWVPLKAGTPVEAVLRAGNTILARHVFEPSAGAYFCNGGLLDIVSSSHQDTAWMDTPDFCRNFRVEQNIVPALAMMAKDPHYCFAMECTLHLMEFLEAHPERRDEVVRLMKEGRLEFGATYNQPYESYLSGEELVRQVYYGRRWIRKHLPGCDARVAFNPDVPARAIQMQQILAKAGVPYLFFSRYHEGLYRWYSPDGSGVLAYTPGHYGNDRALLNGAPERCIGAIQAKLEQRGSYYAQRHIPPGFCLVNSMDFSRPTDFRPLIAAWNAQGQGRPDAAPQDLLTPPVMQYASIHTFFTQIDKPEAHFDTLMGERPDVWLYIHGPTHHRTTSLRREAARLLPAAETFTTMACLLDGSFDDYPTEALDEAWMSEIYIDHGIGGKNGHITDEVFHRKVKLARDTGRALLDKALTNIACRVKSASPSRGAPITVFNTLSWARSAPVTIDLPDEIRPPVRIVDAAGKEVACQVTTVGVPDEVDVAGAAMGATATASSVQGPEYGAANAINGCWAVRDPSPEVGASDKWNSAAGGGPHHLMVDFGRPRTIHKVVLRHEGVIGAFKGEACYNTRDFQLQGADAPAGPWSDLVPPVTGNIASLTVHVFAPRTVRYVRLVVTRGTQTGGDGAARIYELQAFEKIPAKPPRVVFLAEDVSSLGYKTFYLTNGEPTARRAPRATVGVCDSRFYNVTLAPGGIRGIFDKQQKRNLLDTSRFLGGEVFTMLSVAPSNRGRGTDAGEFGAVPMPVMDASFDRVANRKPAWSLIENGPVRTVYALEQPMGGATVRQRVVVWHGIKRIDCEADLATFNGSLWREFRMALPLAMKKPTIAYEVPMSVVEIGKDEIPTTGGHAYGHLTYYEQCSDIRPREVQNFVDASDAAGGLTLSSCVSVFDWVDPTTNAPVGTVLQPVLLASRKSCNGRGNWYPQAGDHHYRFSITSHNGDWRNGRQGGISANYALIPVLAAPAAGASLPPEMSFVSLSADSVIVSTVKKCEDDAAAVVRLVETEGRDTDVTLRPFFDLAKAEHTNIIEEDGKPVQSATRALETRVGHHAIETFKLWRAP